MIIYDDYVCTHPYIHPLVCVTLWLPYHLYSNVKSFENLLQLLTVWLPLVDLDINWQDSVTAE